MFMLPLVHERATNIAPEVDVMMADALSQKMKNVPKMGADTGGDGVGTRYCV